MASALGSNKGRGAGKGGNGRPLTTQDNGMAPEERRKAEEEAEKLALISVVSQVKAIDPKIEAKSAELKALKDQRTDIFRAAKAAYGFVRKEIEDLIADSKVGARKDVEEAEARRRRFRIAMGLPVGLTDQEQELQARLPDVEKDASWYRAAGYTAGVTGGDLDPPPACVAAGHVGPWSEGVKDGQTILALALKKPKKPTAEPPKPEPSIADQKAAEAKEARKAKEALENMPTRDEIKAEIADMFELDGSRPRLAVLKAIVQTSADGDAVEAAATVAEREAAGEVADPAEVAKFVAEFEAMKEDEFEATAEELAKQATRRAVQDARTGSTTGEEAEAV